MKNNNLRSTAIQKTIIVCTAFIVILACLIFYANKNSNSAVIGVWTMESIFDYDGKTLTKSDENTFDWTCEFKDDNTFIIVNTPNESLCGKYDSTKATGAILLTLEFDDGSTAQATYGERKYNDGQSVDSLNLTTNDKFVTFLKDAQKPK